MKKNILSLIVTAAVCASVMLAVIGIYRLIAEPVFNAPSEPAFAFISIL